MKRKRDAPFCELTSERPADLHLAAEGQRPGGRGLHRHADLRAPHVGREEPGAGGRRVQVHLAAALPGAAPHAVAGVPRPAHRTGSSARRPVSLRLAADTVLRAVFVDDIHRRHAI